MSAGIYKARVQRVEYTTMRAGAVGYRMRFEITEGPHGGKTVLRSWAFGLKAIGYTKRDLTPFGLTSSAKLLCLIPEPGREYLMRLVVALQRGDDGIEVMVAPAGVTTPRGLTPERIEPSFLTLDRSPRTRTRYRGFVIAFGNCLKGKAASRASPLPPGPSPSLRDHTKPSDGCLE